jgi:outer membrane protein assembly factor BamA
LGYEAVVRHISDLAPTASISMREAAGESLKSSISHTYLLDTRDDRIMANKGVYAKLYHEFAGLGGDASFYKAEAEGQVSRPVYNGVVSSFLGSSLSRSNAFLVNLPRGARRSPVQSHRVHPLFRPLPIGRADIHPLLQSK